MSWNMGFINPWGGKPLLNVSGLAAAECGSADTIIEADLAQAGTVAANFTSLKDTLTTIATDSRTTVNDTEHSWSGTDADTFRTVGRTAASTVNSLVAPLETMIAGYATFTQSITFIRDLVDSVLDTGDAAANVRAAGMMSSPSAPVQFSSLGRGGWAVASNDSDTYAGIEERHPMPSCSTCAGIDWNRSGNRANPPRPLPGNLVVLRGWPSSTPSWDPSAAPGNLTPSPFDLPVDCGCPEDARAVAATRDAKIDIINAARLDLARHRADATTARTTFTTTAEQAYAALSLPVDSTWGSQPEVPVPADVPPAGPPGGPGGPPAGGGGGGPTGGGRGGPGPISPGGPPEPELGGLGEAHLETAILEPVEIGEPVEETSVDSGATTPPPDERWVAEELAGRDVSDGTWTVEDDARWTSYMLSDPEFQDRVGSGATDACRDAVSTYLRTGTSVGEFTSAPDLSTADGAPTDASVGAGRHSAAPVDAPATRPSFGDRLGALPTFDLAPATVDGSQPEHDAGELTHAGSTTVVPLGDGRFAVTVDVEHTYSDRIEPGETFEPGSWQDGASELLTDGIEEPYDLEVSWTEQQTVILDAQGQVYTLEPAGDAAMSGPRGF